MSTDVPYIYDLPVGSLSEPQPRVRLPYQFHGATSYVPRMTGREFQELCDSIQEHGLLEPIKLLKGFARPGEDPELEIIAGRHRALACARLGIEPRYEILPEGTPPWAYVLAENTRREMTMNAKMRMLENMLPMLRMEHDLRHPENKESFAQAVARSLHVSERSAYRMMKVVELSPEEVKEAVAQGLLSVTEAEAAIPREEENLESDPCTTDGTSPALDPEGKPTRTRPPAYPQDVIVDAFGQKVPDHLEEVFVEGAQKFASAVDLADRLRKLLFALRNHPAGKATDCKVWWSYARTITYQLDLARPWNLCTKCKGRKCPDCKERGWQPKAKAKGVENARA